MPREQLLDMLKKLHGDREIAADARSYTQRAWTEDFHRNFDAVATQESYKYSKKPGSFDLEFAEPGLLIQHVLSESPRLARAWVAALGKQPCSPTAPWKCIIGYDEFSPGDKFSYERSKTIMCLYFTFIEVDAASQGCAWFCPLVVRATQADSVCGGWSHILACFLHRMFLGTYGLQTVGTTFRYRERDYLIFAYLSNLISDGDGIRKGIGWKGHASLRPSLVHSNILKKDSDLANRADGYVEITCTESRLLRKATADEFNDSCDLVAEAHARWQRGEITKALFENVSMTEGMNFVPGGVAFDMRLRGRVMFFLAITMDWVHTFLQDGVMNVEACLMIGACAVNIETLRRFLSLPWQFPHHMQSKGQQLWRIFSDTRLDEHGEVDKIRATASELLGLYSLLRHFVSTEIDITAELQPNWDSFDACCKLLDLIAQAKQRLVSARAAAPELRRRMRRFMRLHKRCYGTRHIRPKHAWVWGIAEHWERDDDVFDQFIIERLHLTVKATAQRLKSLVRLERTILCGTLNTQLSLLQSLNASCCLLDERPIEVDSMPGTFLADAMQISGMSLHVDDVVFYGEVAGLLLACVLEDDVIHGIVEMWRAPVVLTPHAKRWRRNAGAIRILPASELDQALAAIPLIE